MPNKNINFRGFENGKNIEIPVRAHDNGDGSFSLAAQENQLAAVG